MTNTVKSYDSSELNANFLEEYSTEESIRKYTGKTAGHGISYLLDHDYRNIYFDSIERFVPKSRLKSGIRLWEFGCGSGMNLLHLISALGRQGIPMDFACGTDFSGPLIAAARSEADKYIAPGQIGKIHFTVASNEGLVEEGAKALGSGKDELLGSFDLVFGVNTIRYNHRLNNVDRCVRGIGALLSEGGICILIDMNRKFPAFRSRLRQRLSKQDEKATLLPTLDEYASPFSAAGFEILEKRNFCWIPHSAGAGLTTVMRGLTPILNIMAPSRGMRSLVIARKVSQGPR
jgi:SAM-dependent methyltransferase